MVRREEHRHPAPLRLPQRIPERRALEPGAGEVPERRRVPRHLEEGRVLGPAVGELVDEVEDQRGDAVLGEVRRQTAEQAVAVGGGEHLLVMHRHLAAGQLLELLGQELGLVGVETGLLVVGPPPRVAGLDLRREEPAEDRVARERRRGRQDREVVGGLDVESGGDQRPDHGPLVQPETVHHHQQHLPCMSSTGLRNSAPMSTESGGRSLSPSCSQRA